jgi:hypothetical protein
MTHGISGWVLWFVGLNAAAPAMLHAAPAPVTIATCGDSSIEVTAGKTGGSATLHGVVVTGHGERWSFTANVGLSRIGATTRTITVEDIHTVERKPPHGDQDIAPSGLFVDLWLVDKKVILRHASEGAPDPAYAVDLDRCRFEGDAAIVALVAPPAEPVGCDAATVRGGYRTQVARAAKLPDADVDREAQALCEDHQKTIEARNRLEAAISDRAARDRVAARGAALLHIEDTRLLAWNRMDGCIGADPAKAHGVAALHEGEAKLRACYGKIAARP